jgi:small subunit ribosomal protein S17e
MGRIKTIFIKRVGRELFEANADKFGEDYSKNKEVVKQLADIQSKKLLNIVAGYVTTLKKQKRL